MKRPNRETQIFNLSMMDVISGAMGAFLIIMVIMSQSYQNDPATTKNVQDLQDQLDEALDELQETRTLLDDRNVRQKIENAQQQIRQARQEAEVVKENLNQSQKKIARLDAELQDTQQRLNWSKPVMVQLKWSFNPADVDLYIESFALSAKTHKKEMPAFNPYEQQWSFWAGDIAWDEPSSPGPDIWVISKAVPDIDYKIYYKIAYDGQYQYTKARAYLIGNYAGQIDLPELTLTKEKPWVYVGTLRFDEDGKAIWQEATEEEREQDRQDVIARVGTAKLEKKIKEQEEQDQKNAEEERKLQERISEDQKLSPEERLKRTEQSIIKQFGAGSPQHQAFQKDMQAMQQHLEQQEQQKQEENEP